MLRAGMASCCGIDQTGLVLADRILRGANLGDPAVQLPKKRQLVFSMNTARALNLTAPTSMQFFAEQRVA